MFGWFKRTPVETHDPVTVADRLRAGAIRLVDVREPGEWAQGHIAGATHIPLGQLGTRLSTLPKDKPVVFYCLSGGRSASAVGVARRAGLEGVAHMGGGITAWRLQGLPVSR